MNESTSQRFGRKRLVVADREPSVRGALGALATQCLDMDVVGEACSEEALRYQARLLNPQLVVVAWDLLRHATSSLPATIRRGSRDVRIVALGIRPESREAALSAGADGFVSVADRPEVVVRVLSSCLQLGKDTAGTACAPLRRPGEPGESGDERRPETAIRKRIFIREGNDHVTA